LTKLLWRLYDRVNKTDKNRARMAAEESGASARWRTEIRNER
jgi:hypothetical protein